MCNLYDTIERLCQQKGISITTMCHESGAPRGSLGDLKAGRCTGLSAPTLAKIANYFNVSVDYLLGNEKKPEPVDVDINEIVENASVPELVALMKIATERLNRLMGK